MIRSVSVGEIALVLLFDLVVAFSHVYLVQADQAQYLYDDQGASQA